MPPSSSTLSLPASFVPVCPVLSTTSMLPVSVRHSFRLGLLYMRMSTRVCVCARFSLYFFYISCLSLTPPRRQALRLPSSLPLLPTPPHPSRSLSAIFSEHLFRPLRFHTLHFSLSLPRPSLAPCTCPGTTPSLFSPVYVCVSVSALASVGKGGGCRCVAPLRRAKRRGGVRQRQTCGGTCFTYILYLAHCPCASGRRRMWKCRERSSVNGRCVGCQSLTGRREKPGREEREGAGRRKSKGAGGYTQRRDDILEVRFGETTKKERDHGCIQSSIYATKSRSHDTSTHPRDTRTSIALFPPPCACLMRMVKVAMMCVSVFVCAYARGAISGTYHPRTLECWCFK